MKFSKLSIKNYLNLSNVLLLLILVVAVFFRFYNTPARYGFDFDPTRDVLIILYGAKNLTFPLIGASSGIAPITFGPWYYYQMILWQILFPFYYSAWYLVGISSVLVSVFLYKIGKLLENKWFGLLLAFFAAVSPSETGQTQGLSNPDLIPLYSILVIWLFVQLFLTKKSKGWWYVMWGFILGVGINIHFQMMGLLVLPVIFFILKPNDLGKRLLLFFIGFFPPWIPLIIFNYLYNWHTLKGVEYFASHHPYVANGWKIYLFQFWIPFWSYIFGVNNFPGVLLLIFAVIVIAYVTVKKRLKLIYVLLLITLAINFIVLRYAIAQRNYYYYLYLHSFIFIIFALAIWNTRKTKLGILLSAMIVIVLTFFMVKQDLICLQSRADQMSMKNIAHNFMRQYPNKNIAVYACGKGGQNYAQGIEFFLLQADRLSTNGAGARIGMADFSCPLKVTASVVSLDLSHTTRNDIQKQGWKLITPKIVYNNTLMWWNK